MFCRFSNLLILRRSSVALFTPSRSLKSIGAWSATSNSCADWSHSPKSIRQPRGSTPLGKHNLPLQTIIESGSLFGIDCFLSHIIQLLSCLLPFPLICRGIAFWPEILSINGDIGFVHPPSFFSGHNELASLQGVLELPPACLVFLNTWGRPFFLQLFSTCR